MSIATIKSRVLTKVERYRQEALDSDFIYTANCLQHALELLALDYSGNAIDKLYQSNTIPSELRDALLKIVQGGANLESPPLETAVMPLPNVGELQMMFSEHGFDSVVYIDGDGVSCACSIAEMIHLINTNGLTGDEHSLEYR